MGTPGGLGDTGTHLGVFGDTLGTPGGAQGSLGPFRGSGVSLSRFWGPPKPSPQTLRCPQNGANPRDVPKTGFGVSPPNFGIPQTRPKKQTPNPKDPMSKGSQTPNKGSLGFGGVLGSLCKFWGPLNPKFPPEQEPNPGDLRGVKGFWGVSTQIWGLGVSPNILGSPKP